jgi:hypothetical protein
MLDLTQSSKGARQPALVFALAAAPDGFYQVTLGVAKPPLQSRTGRFREQFIDGFGYDGRDCHSL